MISIREAEIPLTDRADVVPAPWNVAEDIRLQARYLRNAVKRIAGQFVSVGVTSLGPGEGVSWVAAKLACAFAEEAEQTVLIDLNRRHPTQVESFACDQRGGLEHVIPGLRCCMSTMSNLLVAVPGSEVWYAAARLKERNVVIDFDCMNNSAEINANRYQLDGAVLVVESQKQRREAIANALERLQLSGIPVLGVVVNRKRQYVPQAIYNLL
jgi:Mrp family chromosome partitioning ATPase